VPPPIRISEIVAATGGRLSGDSTVTAIRGAVVDSRAAVPGCLFVAMPGAHDDGHRYIAEAISRGAAAILVERPVPVPAGAPVAIIQVSDSLLALQEVAAWWRSRSPVRVVGVTGSTGKTIAKEMIADVLARGHRVLRSTGNQNSESGLPMSLLNLEPGDEVAVLEMGMYTTGEIARLTEIARPAVGVVLAVHPTHLERAGSLDQIAAAKSELPAALPKEGLAVLNADDSRVAAMRSVTTARVRTFGLGAEADVRATEVTSRGLEGTEFTLTAPWGERRLRSAALGRHLVPTALAAAAVAEEFGVGLDEVEAALAAGSSAPHRMVALEAVGGATVIDDSYNASPESVVAALTFLAETPVGRGRRLAVLGDMLELGPDEERLHRQVGAAAASVVDGLLAVGSRGAWVAEAARSAGLTGVLTATDADEAIATIDRGLAPKAGDIVLVKGSRGMALERLVDALSGTSSEA
jgi:UDP-N-acetylmuramoyl-tripeptide--D-alanyl-D-alanine ligase